MYIGIIGAMDEEIDSLISKMTEKKEEKHLNMIFYIGKLENKKVIIAKCFVGKVNAAICTQVMILKYKVKMIINVGVAGSLCSDFKIGSIAISKNVVEFDLDVSVLGYEIGYVFGLDKVYIECDEKISKKLYEIAQKTKFAKLGTIASSDKFISSQEESKKIKESFNAIAVDMESASIAHVCFLNNIPFCALRAISDGTDCMEYRDFLDIAVKKIDVIILEFLKEI